MFPEKAKNKQKNGHQSPKPPVRFMLSAILLLLGGIFLYYLSLPTCNLPAPKLLSNLQSLQIQDYWTGLSQTAPEKADYSLTMTDGALVGDATFSITYDSLTESSEIEIPAEAVDAFIKMLETVKLQEGIYEPFWQWTDDYPYISFLFQTDHGDIEIFTSSQGESHSPWGARIGDVEYVIASDIPMQALAILEPYLKRDILTRMIGEYQG